LNNSSSSSVIPPFSPAATALKSPLGPSNPSNLLGSFFVCSSAGLTPPFKASSSASYLVLICFLDFSKPLLLVDSKNKLGDSDVLLQSPLDSSKTCGLPVFSFIL